jgi:hypothetical protein
MRTFTRLAATATLLAMLAGCSSSRPADSAITQEIQSKLFSSAETKSASIEVSTNAGVVTLSGTVPSDASRYEAYKIATEANGVSKVSDQLTLAAAQTAPAPPASAPVPPAPKPVRTPQPAKPRPSQRESASAYQPKAIEPPPPAPAPTPVAEAQPPAPPPFVKPTPAPPPPPVMRTVEVPVGTIFHVQMVDSVDSAVNKAGEVFRATLAAPILVNNEVVVPAGADLDVKLTDASSSGRIAGRSALTLQLSKLDYQGRTYDLASTDFQQTGRSEGKRTAATVGGAAAIGAVIGGLIGGGKGAAIGAGTGAGAGTVASAATKGQQVQIPSESKLEFTLQQPVSVTYNPDKVRTAR